MLSNLVFNLILSISVFAVEAAQDPKTDPGPTAAQKAAAEEAGKATGTSTGYGVAADKEKGYSTQTTTYNSLENSSLDSMMNSQKGNASAVLMSGGLTTAAGTYQNTCDPKTLSGIEACAAGSVLTGMASAMDSSALSFNDPTNLAWSNVCHFSTIGCNAPVVPNPFIPIIQSQPNPTSTIPGLISTFSQAGFTIDPHTGIVKSPNGKIINPNAKNGLENGLGEDGGRALRNLLDRMQKDIANKLSKVTRASYLTTLGIGSLKDMNNKIADELKGASDIAKEKEARERANRRIRFNRLPEKDREPTEVEELVKNFNGTPIGVANGNIFKTIKKRYEIKASQKVFLQPVPVE